MNVLCNSIHFRIKGIQYTFAFQKFALYHFTCVKNLHYYLYSLTETQRFSLLLKKMKREGETKQNKTQNIKCVF